MRWTLILGLWAAVACVETKTARGGQCSLTSDCDAPLVCRFQACRVECTTNRDCALGLDCLYDATQFGACQLPEEATCLSDDNCGEGQICRVRDGRVQTCTTECQLCPDEDDTRCAEFRGCPPGATCMDGACIDPDSTPCLYNTECDDAKACAFDQRCRDECFTDEDCRPPLTCRDFDTDAGQQRLCDIVVN
ncbi:MAG: hypothetical protein AAGE52_32020 [Myxococcota bacterium]